MKSILLSIKPKWVEKILNGEKTIEIRKTMPKCDLPIDVYIYCTKEKPLLLYRDIEKEVKLYGSNTSKKCYIASVGRRKTRLPNQYDLSGKVVVKFTLRKVEEITATEDRYGEETWYETYSLACDELLEKSCLDFNELDEYMYGKYGNAQGYAYHIEDLVIFDKPRELSEFKHICPNIMCDKCNYADLSTDKCLPICSNQLKKAPQNFCYVESEE